jgi:hypothetical protein
MPTAAQRILVLSDDTYDEHSTDGDLNGASAIDIGDLKTALAHGSSEETLVFQC